jgi:GTP-binding protein
MGIVMQKLGPRKAEMNNMTSAVNGYTRLEFLIPARGLLGFRNEFMTDTKGNGIMNHVLNGFDAYKGEIPGRSRGSVIAFETGTAIAYSMANAQERGALFIEPGEEIYAGMVVGECSRADDLEVNVCKKKHLSNMRSAGADDSNKLTPVTEMSLEQCIEFISADELVEITPKNIRLRKKILDADLRKKAGRSK